MWERNVNHIVILKILSELKAEFCFGHNIN